jgi:hypothetical protein
MAAIYGFTEHQVLTMHQTDHIGWSDLENLLSIVHSIVLESVGSKKPITRDQVLAQVLTQRQSGMGIGQIASSHNVKLGL